MKLRNSYCSFSRAAHSLLLLLITQNFHNSFEQRVERLPLGSILQPNQTLVSRNGRTFSLGFFKLGPDRYYLGISYSRIIPIFSRRIWVANRNDPARDGAFLRFSRDGNLAVSNPDQTIVWMSGTSGMNISSMMIEESGNLVLAHNSGRPIWQSFDHPADSWVPGMKFYVGSSFISSKSSIDPAEGRFSLRLLPSGEAVSIWNETTEYWTTGVWNGQTFANVPELNFDWNYTFSFPNDPERPYLEWSGKPSVLFDYTLDLEPDGIVRLRTWDITNSQWNIGWSSPIDPCQVDHLCGQNGICNSDTTPFCTCLQGFKPVDPTGWSVGDWSMGCVSNFTWGCSIKEFSTLKNTCYDQWCADAGSLRSCNGHDQAWCRDACTADCACLGFYLDRGFRKCSLQYGPFFNVKTSPDIAQTFFLRVNSSQVSSNSESLLPNNAKRKRKETWKLGLGVAVGCVLLILIALLTLKILRKRRIFTEKVSSEYISGFLKNFSYKELQTATSNFSEKLGDGGFGSVYKGSLPNHTMVAVKKLHNLKQGDKDFHREVSTIGMIQHANLVRLRGFCADTMHRLLVYEHIVNGSLDTLLFRKRGVQQQIVLDWETRFAIALDTARGIVYLHEECRNCIIHCDIKPENILLDANFRAKVSDFGLAKLMGREFSRVITSIRGTRGYLAPEWLSGLPITAKADVYSYGMTLFETISGRKNVDVNNSSLDKWFFPLWACQQARLGDFSSLADVRLYGSFDEQQLRKAVLVAIWCIQDEEFNRPSMAKILQMLEGTCEVADPPFPKSITLLEVERDNSELELSKLSVEDELEVLPTRTIKTTDEVDFFGGSGRFQLDHLPIIDTPSQDEKTS